MENRMGEVIMNQVVGDLYSASGYTSSVTDSLLRQASSRFTPLKHLNKLEDRSRIKITTSCMFECIKTEL